MNRPLPPDPKQAHKSDRFLATPSPTPTARIVKLRRLTVCPPGIAWGRCVVRTTSTLTAECVCGRSVTIATASTTASVLCECGVTIEMQWRGECVRTPEPRTITEAMEP